MPLTDEYSNIVFLGSKGTTNDATPVVLVDDPGTVASAYIVDVESLGVLNRDTVNSTVIISQTGGSTVIVDQITLAPGEKWTNGQKYSVFPGQTLTIALAATVATNQLTWTVTQFYTTD